MLRVNSVVSSHVQMLALQVRSAIVTDSAEQGHLWAIRKDVEVECIVSSE